MKKILVVEDDEWLAEQYERILSKNEYEIFMVNNALSAMDVLDNSKIDAIVLDILLPENTAFELLNELQSYADTGCIPVVVCSSLAGEISFDDIKPYGVVGILDKTVMAPNDLLLELTKILS